jgi:hypothetical protein
MELYGAFREIQPLSIWVTSPAFSILSGKHISISQYIVPSVVNYLVHKNPIFFDSTALKPTLSEHNPAIPILIEQ